MADCCGVSYGYLCSVLSGCSRLTKKQTWSWYDKGWDDSTKLFYGLMNGYIEHQIKTTKSAGSLSKLKKVKKFLDAKKKDMEAQR